MQLERRRTVCPMAPVWVSVNGTGACCWGW